jgi:hypothetical protein
VARKRRREIARRLLRAILNVICEPLSGSGAGANDSTGRARASVLIETESKLQILV